MHQRMPAGSLQPVLCCTTCQGGYQSRRCDVVMTVLSMTTTKTTTWKMHLRKDWLYRASVCRCSGPPWLPIFFTSKNFAIVESNCLWFLNFLWCLSAYFFHFWGGGYVSAIITYSQISAQSAHKHHSYECGQTDEINTICNETPKQFLRSNKVIMNIEIRQETAINQSL